MRKLAVLIVAVLACCGLVAGVILWLANTEVDDFSGGFGDCLYHV